MPGPRHGFRSINGRLLGLGTQYDRRCHADRLSELFHVVHDRPGLAGPGRPYRPLRTLQDDLVCGRFGDCNPSPRKPKCRRSRACFRPMKPRPSPLATQSRRNRISIATAKWRTRHAPSESAPCTRRNCGTCRHRRCAITGAAGRAPSSSRCRYRTPTKSKTLPYAASGCRRGAIRPAARRAGPRLFSCCSPST